MSDQRIRELLHDAVAEVEPQHALEHIRARTAVRPARAWLPVGGTVLAVAAAVTAFAVLGTGSDRGAEPAPGPASSGTASPGTPTPTTSTEPEPDTGPDTTVAVYYVGDTERAGPRLFREFRRLATSDPLDTAVATALGRGPDGTSLQPLDPDYRSAWPAGTRAETTFEGDGGDGTFVVDLGGDVDGGLRRRPPGMSEAEAAMAVEQLVWTAQAAGQVRAPVRILVDGQITDQVLGVPTSEPLAQGPALQVLNLVSLTSPAQGDTVEGETLRVTGVANAFEATVGWELLRDGQPVRTGFATADGWMGERLFPFATELDVSGLAPGDYTLVVSTGDASGGEEGVGAMTDTRLVTLG